MNYAVVPCVIAVTMLPTIGSGIGPAFVTTEPLSEQAFFWFRASVFEAQFKEIVCSNSQGLFVRVSHVNVLKKGRDDLPVTKDETVLFLDRWTLMITQIPKEGRRMIFTGYPRDRQQDIDILDEDQCRPKEFIIIPFVVMPWKGKSFLPIMDAGELTPEKQKLFDNMLATCIRESEKVYQNKKK